MARASIKGLSAEIARLNAHIATLEHLLVVANEALAGKPRQKPAPMFVAFKFKDAGAVCKELSAETKRSMFVAPVTTPRGIAFGVH
jgi:hypothetical protein